MTSFTFRLPDVGEGTVEAEIVAWHVKAGDVVEEDQPLVDVMTDKATVEITSPRAGRLASIHGEPGAMLPVGAPLAVFESDRPDGVVHGEPPLLAASQSPSPEGETPVRPRPGASNAAPAFFESEDPRVLTSPAIRRRARELGVDLATVKGSGPEGRITREDFDAHVAGEAAGAPDAPRLIAAVDAVTEVKIIGLRRKIAEKMSEAKRRIPHFAYIEECDVTEMEELRIHLNATKDAAQAKLTFLPFMITALCKALPNYPQINARFDDEAGIVRRYASVHLGMATQTQNGLVVPVIRHAEAYDLWGLAREIARLANATREGKATAAELSGSTITLTSLGPLGGLAHTPVINHPEVAIVGPNKIIDRPVVRQGQIVVRKMMNISSSFDHRVVDGWDAAAFIQTLKALLEHPATLFLP
jgi:2-oxoisovalerate dehydrogenase E2 component (dihydrolipoyl transacylase)